MAGTFTLTGLSASEPQGERVFGPATIVGEVVIGETLALGPVARPVSSSGEEALATAKAGHQQPSLN